MKVGTLEWAERTGGRLRARDRLSLLGQGLISQSAELPAQLLGRLGIPLGRRARVELDDIRIPDSAACREAKELADSQQPAMLADHCLRTYLWASILGRHRGWRFDEEVLFVSAMLHDLGLSEAYRAANPPTCFTLTGARTAESVARGDGWAVARARRAAEAITLHMNLIVRPKDGAEAALMMAGTQLDVIGAGYWRLHAQTREQVLGRYPRHGVKCGMGAIFAEHARNHPGSRATMYQRYLGLPLLIRAAPFVE